MASMSNEPEKPKPWLLVGLGNPGNCYGGTRHNVGFELVDFIAEAEGIAVGDVSFKSSFGKGFIGDFPVMLAKPQTFMNASGESISPFSDFGGHGSTFWMRSIMSHLKGCKDFPRLRIGIGRPPGRTYPVNFVLGPFNREEAEELEFSFQNGLKAV